eukprot:scaffold4493_cov205-Skeletonema_dohrnii-CCMP3373.AAC.4
MRRWTPEQVLYILRAQNWERMDEEQELGGSASFLCHRTQHDRKRNSSAWMVRELVFHFYHQEWRLLYLPREPQRRHLFFPPSTSDEVLLEDEELFFRSSIVASNAPASHVS